MGVEESEVFWIVKGKRIDGKEIRRSDYTWRDIPIDVAIDYAFLLMRDNGIVKAKVYVFKKVAEREIDLTEADKK